ncbi:MAG: tetratricopeptide repeat protein [Halobacteriovoraceae bacterium]|nr:tetratricopeptide repeat protein [Halobacteriovoraceae bacterium]
MEFSSSKLELLKDRAQRCFREGKLEKALLYVDEVISQDPNDSETYFLKANVFHVQGKIGKAVKTFKQVIEMNNDHTDAMVSLSVLLNDIGRYEEAKKYFELADKKVKKGDNGGVVDNHINKKFSAHHYEIAEMYFAYGRYDEALTEYNKASSLDPANLMIKVKIAKVYSKKGFYSKAIDEFRSIKRLDAGFLPARMALGLHYYTNGKIIEAQNEWKNILQKDPEHKEAQMYLKLSQNATEVSL